MRFVFCLSMLNICIMLECYLTEGAPQTGRSQILKKALANHHHHHQQQPEPVRKEGECPPPTTLFGPCIFNATYNCRNDGGCRGEMKCCREGCNKICKMPRDESNPFIWEWFDEHADQVAKMVEVSEDWLRQSLDSFWDMIAETTE